MKLILFFIGKELYAKSLFPLQSLDLQLCHVLSQPLTSNYGGMHCVTV